MSDTPAAHQLSAEKQALLALRRMRARLEEIDRLKTEPIAIIGASCRFPGGATSLDGYWQILRDGIEAVTEVPRERWDVDAYYDPDPETTGKTNTRRGGFVRQLDEFDPQFFGIAPREAVQMDPQHRLLLEVSWEALEHAGQAPDRLAGSRTGVFVGITGSDYAHLLLQADPAEVDAYCVTGNSPNFAAGRLSYLLGLQGPSMTLDTACSSSLVAVHLACQSLRSGESRMALAGGTNVILTPEHTVLLSKARMLASDGRCKTFDEAADGYVRGEGCGVVVLKRLSDAVADGDRVLALIRGTAVNQDGRSSGLTVPNGPAQEALIREALANGRVEADRIAYVEAHGSGTSLGDPIEVRALNAALCQGRPRERALIIGSAKTNIGHLEAAAGIAGLIKVVLSLERGEIPQHLHFATPNHHIPWETLPIVVASSRRTWPETGQRRLAGVSSFGASGTNAHVILEEAPPAERLDGGPDRPLHVIALSARSDQALRQLVEAWSSRLEEDDSLPPGDLAFTANAGRAHFSRRLAAIASTTSELREQLAGAARGEARPGVTCGDVPAAEVPKVAFLFTGQGAQYVGMGRELYETQPTFQQAFDRCDELCSRELPRSLRSALYPEAGASSPIDETSFTQPGLFALEFALTELLKSWGIQPAAAAGHSVGAYAAACAAGVLALEDAVTLITARGRLMQTLPPGGAMAAVFADEARVRAAIAPDSALVAIAALNGPDNVVISGAQTAVERGLQRLAADGVRVERLVVSHAFHSPLMEPMLDDFERVAERVTARPPQIALISDLTGELLEKEPSPAYWRRHAREPVRFGAALATLYARGCRLFVEVGPGPTLSGIGRRCLPDDAEWLPLLRKSRSDWQQLLQTIGTLYVRGVDIDWAGFERDYPRRKLAMPTYPFQRQRHWIKSTRRQAPNGEPAVEPRTDWLYEVEWAAKPAPGSVDLPLALPAATALVDRVVPQVDQLCARHGLETYWDFAPQLETLCSAHVRQAFADLGCDLRIESVISRDVLRREGGVLDRHARLFERMLEILAESGVLRRSGASWQVIGVPEPPALDVMSRDLLERFPEYADEITLADRCGRSLAEVLRGRRDPMDLLFPEGSLAQLERVYQDAPGARVFNGLVQATVGAALSARAPRRRIRVLEVGAGTGATATYLLPKFDPHRTSYTFTDVSNAFLARAKEKFREHAFVDYRLLDIGRDPVEQGFEPHSFDLIVASHVLHATPDLRRTLANVSSLLASEGLLVLLESTQPRRFLDITFGLTEGWWGFADTDVRPSSVLVSSDRWTRLLQEAGFVETASMGDNIQGHETGAAVIVARAPRAERAAPATAPGWIVLADSAGSGERLARVIRARGTRCTVVLKGRSFQTADADRVQMDPLQGEDYVRLVEIARDPQRPCCGIVHLWSLDERVSVDDEADEIDRAHQRACGSVLSLAQTLATSGLEVLPRLIVVTRGAQPVLPEPGSVEPLRATAWGLGRAIAREHPELPYTCVDLDPESDPSGDEIEALYDEVLAAPEEEQVALRRGDRFLPRLVRSTASSGSSLPPALSRDAGYLVTGGLGGVGLLVAQRLAERGAGRVVLMGRTGPSEAAERTIQAMTAGGTQVLVVQADVADRSAIARVIDRLQSDGTPLRGVVHSAGALDDGVLLHQNWARFRTVMAAKVQGSWNLHVLTRSLPLDFFVLFSSSASLFGPPGQGNHAAVNAFVDALAHHRRTEGLPGLSINWGPWSQVGAAARAGVVDRSELHGLGAIDPDQGLMLLEHVIREGRVQVGVLPIDWSRLSEATSAGAVPALLRHLARQAGAQAASAAQTPKSPSFLQQLEATPPHRCHALVLAHVGAQASRVLGLDPDVSLDPLQGLRHLGLDSLMALELRNRLQRSVGQALRSTLAFDYPTVGAIARHLLHDVLGIEQATDRPEPAPSSDNDDPSDLLRSIEELSDEQAERLFAERVGSQGA